MSKIEKSSLKLAQVATPLASGIMYGKIDVGEQCADFDASYVYAEHNAEVFRFFGRHDIHRKSDSFTAIEVRLKPGTVESGTYHVGKGQVEIYYVTTGYDVYEAKSGRVDFNRSDNLSVILGSVNADFNVAGQSVFIEVFYYIRNWNH